VQSATASLKSAMGGLGEEAGALGLAEAQLESARDRHTNLNTTLGSQLADVEEVDLATTLTALQDTQTRLQASWQALSMLSGLSLTDFLR
jgi:flagellar hook-associated protein 3 FlgL